MRRREFITLVGCAAAWPCSARAQQGRVLPVIGFLHPGFLTYPGGGGTNIILTALEQGLREGGYVSGETVRIEARWAQGKTETLTELAQELVGLKVDVLVAVARLSIEAAKSATKELPIVAFDLESDPVAAGFIAGWSAPGGNITGLFLDQPGITGKWLQLIKEVVPNAAHLAVLWDTTTGEHQLRALSTAAKAQSIELEVIKFADYATMQGALDAAALRAAPQALIQLSSPLIIAGASRIAEIVARYRIPAISPFRAFPDRGGLMSYGPVLPQWEIRVGHLVASILKGAKPATLPLEQPINFELVVNAKAAGAIGIAIPQALLVRADEVIE
jgi:putative ABC transport system substrate-binding protein